MLKRIFAFVLAGAAALVVTIKLLLDMASIASTIEFLRNHFPLIRVSKQTARLSGLFVGIVVGLSLYRVSPRNSQHQANHDANRSTCEELDDLGECVLGSAGTPRVSTFSLRALN
jgi:hypothetical protein